MSDHSTIHPIFGLATTQKILDRWVRETFGVALAEDRHERIARLVEEVIELAQAEDFPSVRIIDIASHVYAKPKGVARLEAGGVFVTLLAYLNCIGENATHVLQDELRRIYAIPHEVWAKRHALKAQKGIAAKMVATPTPPEVETRAPGPCRNCRGFGRDHDGTPCDACAGSGEECL